MCRAMNPRTIVTCSAVAGAAGAITIGMCFFGLNGYENTPTHRPDHTAKASTARHDASAQYSSLLRFLPTRTNLQLKWAPMGELSSSQPKTRDYANISITRDRVPPPLNLELPTSVPRDVDPLGRSRAARVSSTQAARTPLIDPLAINLNPDLQDQNASLTQDAHLFNRNNGLRGFMAQNWLNKNVGLQGGLAIKEERLRQGSNGLRDNMAVGMGVLLAF